MHLNIGTDLKGPPPESALPPLADGMLKSEVGHNCTIAQFKVEVAPHGTTFSIGLVPTECTFERHSGAKALSCTVFCTMHSLFW